MYLSDLTLRNFKNYPQLNLVFSENINCFVGNNGSGKTNLLDSIYYLAFTKSAFNSNDALSIKHGQSFAVVEGHFAKDDESFFLQCIVKTGEKKVFKKNKVPYEKISEHIGQFPVVLISPNDTDIIREGSEERRKFFDALISQLDQSYLNNLIHYNSYLKQRNSLLKKFNEQNYFDFDLLEPYNLSLLSLGDKIFSVRKKFSRDFLNQFKNHYQHLSGKDETAEIKYDSDLIEVDFKVNFLNSTKKDIAAQRTLTGIHKDDFIFSINDFNLKKFGSQGQQKSFVIALKLTQFEMLKSQKSYKPLLLLDDIFDKLDEPRIEKLLTMIADHSFGQIFVTDARPERTINIFKKINPDIKIFYIENGSHKVSVD